jgi:hypothetical protein
MMDNVELIDSDDMTAYIPVAQAYIKDIFWFVAEYMDLSMALLQCQVFGGVREVWLKSTQVRLNNNKKHHSSQFKLNSSVLADIHSLMEGDLYMHISND